MKLYELSKNDIFKFEDSDTTYIIASNNENTITIQVLHSERKLDISKNGEFSKYYDADIVPLNVSKQKKALKLIKKKRESQSEKLKALYR
jgi:hypothetical protein